MTVLTAGWHAVSQHKLIDLTVVVAAATILAVILLLTHAGTGNAGVSNRLGSAQTTRPAHPQLAPLCNRAAIGSYC